MEYKYDKHTENWKEFKKKEIGKIRDSKNYFNSSEFNTMEDRKSPEAFAMDPQRYVIFWESKPSETTSAKR